MTSKITRINQIAKERPKEIFTSIYHLINKELLKVCFDELDGNKAVGIDKITKDEYRYNLEENLNNLVEKLKNKSYKPNPARKVNIPKANGKVRSLAIANFEDKIVQLALKKIIEAIYEPKFPDNMFGFRPNKNCHDALKQVVIDIEGHCTSYVVEADIKGYFDNINHDKLIECLKLHIKDPNILRLVRKFLKAGILDKGKFYIGEYGTPQGSILSPILANIYMYYTLIKWFEDFIKVKYGGFMSIINYADDFICCFQYKSVAELFYKELLPKRLKQASLELAEDKTRMISFGRFAIENCKKGKPDTFDFLGFTHINAKTRKGKYIVKHKTSKKKMKAKRKEFKMWMKDNMHKPVYEIMETIKKKLIGHYNYYGINNNSKSICDYYIYVKWNTYRILNRRHQKKSMSYEIFNRIWTGFSMPIPHIKVNIG